MRTLCIHMLVANLLSVAFSNAYSDAKFNAIEEYNWLKRPTECFEAIGLFITIVSLTSAIQDVVRGVFSLCRDHFPLLWHLSTLPLSKRGQNRPSSTLSFSETISRRTNSSWSSVVTASKLLLLKMRQKQQLSFLCLSQGFSLLSRLRHTETDNNFQNV